MTVERDYITKTLNILHIVSYISLNFILFTTLTSCLVQYYNKWVSLIGGLMCLVVMFLIDYITALITFIITIALYLFVQHRKPGDYYSLIAYILFFIRDQIYDAHISGYE